MKKLLMLTAALACSGTVLFSQSFLQGDFLELGMNDCGAYGTEDAPPPGYNPTESSFFGSGLSVVADPDQDGFAVGSPNLYCGDYMLPGSPVEGFQIEVDGKVRGSGNQGSPCSIDELNGQIQSVTFTGNLRNVNWQGGLGSGALQMEQNAMFLQGSRSIIHTVEITNNSGDFWNQVYYQRHTDPDPSQAWNGTFSTRNSIRNASVGNGTAVVAVDNTMSSSFGDPTNCFLGLMSASNDARASFGSFFFGTPSDAYNGVFPFTNTLGAVNTADEAVQLTFDLGSLGNGSSVCLSYAYVFDQDEVYLANKATESACDAIDDFLRTGDESTLISALYGSASARPGDQIAIYPNPTSSFVDIDLGAFDGQDIRLRIFDMTGRLVYDQQVSAGIQRVDQNLEKGFYLVQAEVAGKVYSSKLSVQ
jgi:hypothetical protein